MRAGDARQQFHGASVNTGSGIAPGGIGIGGKGRDQQRPARDQRQLIQRAFAGSERGAHLQHDIGARQRPGGIGSQAGARFREGSIGKARGQARTGFNSQGAAHTNQLLHGLRRRGNPRLTGPTFFQNGHFHKGYPRRTRLCAALQVPRPGVHPGRPFQKGVGRQIASPERSSWVEICLALGDFPGPDLA